MKGVEGVTALVRSPHRGVSDQTVGLDASKRAALIKSRS